MTRRRQKMKVHKYGLSCDCLVLSHDHLILSCDQLLVLCGCCVCLFECSEFWFEAEFGIFYLISINLQTITYFQWNNIINFPFFFQNPFKKEKTQKFSSLVSDCGIPVFFLHGCSGILCIFGRLHFLNGC